MRTGLNIGSVGALASGLPTRHRMASEVAKRAARRV
jgi:hypothetical protein